jgi:hypothetical protein
MPNIMEKPREGGHESCDWYTYLLFPKFFYDEEEKKKLSTCQKVKRG